MRNLFMLLMILPIMAICACSDNPTNTTESITERSEPTIEELEAKVIENCYILQAAIEEYRAAVANWYSSGPGKYPPSVTTDPYDYGFTLLDFLPDNELLENPFTGERTEPSTDSIATEPGQIGYGTTGFCGTHQVYAITGCGEDSLVTLLNNIREVEIRIISDCILVQHILQQIIEMHDEDLTFLQIMSELIYMLPGRTYLLNHVMLVPQEPNGGYNPGNIGIIYYGRNSYCITGIGVAGGIIIFKWEAYPAGPEVMIQYSYEVYPILLIISTFKQYE